MGAHNTAVGPLRERVEVLAKNDPEVLRRRIVEDGAEAFCKGIVEAMQPPAFVCPTCRQRPKYNRWAYHLFAHIANLVRSEMAVAAIVLREVGTSAEQARTSVNVIQRVQPLLDDPDAMLKTMLEYVTDKYDEKGWDVKLERRAA